MQKSKEKTVLCNMVPLKAVLPLLQRWSERSGRRKRLFTKATIRMDNLMFIVVYHLFKDLNLEQNCQRKVSL